MPHKRSWEIGSFKVEPPNERSLQVIYSRQGDKGIGDLTVLMSTIAPHSGKTGIHTHPVDEIMYIISGRGEGEEAGKTFKIVPGTIIYAPAGVEHECRNLADETMQMFCVFVPALPDESVERITRNAKLRLKNI